MVNYRRNIILSHSEQDNQILSALIYKDNQTSYALSQTTGISNPQVNFRLGKLVESQVVIESKEDDKTTYSIHNSLKSKDAIKKVSEHIKSICDIIDNEHYATSEGMKIILCFILSKTEIGDSEVIAEEQKIIDEFIIDIEKYAKEHKLIISNIKGWTKNKIEWMALNDRKCACDPGNRICPCQTGLDEINNKGICKCSLFVGEQWIKKMDKKMKGWR